MKVEIKKHILPFLLLIVFLALFLYNRDLIGASVFLIVGGAFLTAGFYFRSTNKRIRANGTKTTAKIVDFAKEKVKDVDGESHVYNFPIVRFTDRKGVEKTQKLDSSANPKRINELINIIYLKKDGEFKIIKDNDWWEKHLPSIILTGGFLFSLIGILMLIRKIYPQ